MSETEVIHLFPLPVFKVNIGKPKRNELEFIESQRKKENYANRRSENSYLLAENELSDLYEKINQQLQVYFDSVHAPLDDVQLSITQSWANYTIGAENHNKHYHANSFVSGVYYPKATDLNDGLCFFSPFEPFQALNIRSKSKNIFNSTQATISVKTGDLVLFPSMLQHAVPSFQRDVTRISLAFNSFLVGVLGNSESLDELTI